VSRRLDRQRILLTGGGSGIGRAVAMAYLAEGAAVTVLERSPDHARELAEVGGPDVDVLVGDATDPAQLAEAVERASGAGGLDNLTSCVGVFDYYASLRTMSAAELVSAADEIHRVNVRSTLSAVHAALPALQRVRGSVTLTLSESAFHPVGGGALYGSSKWALRGVVSHLAADLAPEVRVNAVAPGGTTGTRFGGLSTLGQTQTADRVEGRDERIAAGTLLGLTPRPEDHAGAYVYLADRVAARIVTAVVINTDGGRKP
jgi:NAD(P)-dependent dehydrogenase (short-subunit alcohol dehydrogenase family)